MNKFFLGLAMLPQGLWRRMGADTEQLRAILRVKLTLDNRKPLTISQKQRKASKYSIFLGMLVSFFFGIIYVYPFVTFSDMITAGTVFYSLFLFLLTFSLVSDFSNTLIDTRDKLIIFPRPVNDRTILLARLLHIFLYLFRTVVPMALPGWIVASLAYGWKAAIFFPLPLISTVLLSLFVVMGLYLVLLRFVKAEKFREVLSYFQIVFSVLIFAAVYLLPRVMEQVDVRNMRADQHPSVQGFPSYWLASMWSWMGYKSDLPATPWLGLLAFLLPIACLWLTIRYLAPQFTRKIAGIDGAEGQAEGIAASPGKVPNKKSFYLKLANLLNRSDAANAGFRMTWIQTARNRTFRMRVYPALAYIPVYFVYLLTMNKAGFAETWRHLPETKSYIILLYMCSFVMLQAVYYITISDQYKASWIYYATPVGKPGEVIAGGFKVVWVKFFLPFFTLVSIFVVYVWGIRVIPDILLALVNVTLFAVLISYVAYRQLPFSILDQMNSSGNKVLRSILSMFVPFILGGAHYAALFFWPWLKLLFLALSGILLWMVWDSYLKTSWAHMKTEER